MKRRVLFVDDEPSVLQGLSRMLRPLRDQWDMAFVSRGDEALDLLSREPFDVIVTDMRMPGMDGLALLEQVMTRFPQVVRIILSGHTDQTAALRSAKAVHQFLAKPCDGETLVGTLGRVLALMETVLNPQVRAVVSRLGDLPALPSLYQEILAELQREDPSPNRVGEVVGRDVAMAAKLLQLVNSAFFGLFRAVHSPAEAVRYLGIETVKALVLSFHVFSELRPAPVHGFSAEGLWDHSLRVGMAARRIAWNETRATPVADSSFTSGLLHDVGRLVLATCLSDAYGAVLSQVGPDEEGLWRLEQVRLGASHAEVGAYLVGLWGLPQEIVEATALHHLPSRGPQPVSGSDTVLAVHVAEAMLQDREDVGIQAAKAGIDEPFLRDMGRLDRLQQWLAICRTTCKEDAVHG